MRMTRRRWLATCTSASVAAMAHPLTSRADVPAKGQPPRWEIGCFNRPWSRGSYDEALDGIRAAGFRLTGLLGDHPGEAFILPEATPAYLDRLKERIESRGLKPLVAWLRTSHDVSQAESLARARKQIENAHHLGIKYLLTTGVDATAQYEHFYRVMAEAAALADERQMQIALKPHGGVSAAAEELARCVARVNRANFRVWYDPGNVIHYTGKDPVAEVEPIAPLVSGFCAKDCSGPGADVMVPFGTGKANFAGVFARLKAARFDGPVMVECCGGATLAEITAGARANREYLERVFDAL